MIISNSTEIGIGNIKKLNKKLTQTDILKICVLIHRNSTKYDI